MLGLLLLLLSVAVPLGIWAMRRAADVPKRRWPIFASALRLEYLDKPPRLQGLWNGRRVAAELAEDGRSRVTAFLARPSRLRVEIGPKELVERRAGVIVPDPVSTDDQEFQSRFLVRCSDKSAGQRILDPVLRRRVLDQDGFDMIAQNDRAVATLPELRSVDSLEALLEVLAVVAGEMEAHP